MTNLNGSYFCVKCPVVVFDSQKVGQAVKNGLKDDCDFEYAISGIVNLNAIPKEKRNLEIGTDENPIPLVKFLPNLETKTTGKMKPKRNEFCPCGSSKKYKRCCGK